MRSFIIALVTSFALTGCVLYSLVSRAEAQAATDATAQLDAGPDVLPLVLATAPAPPTIPDPVASPGAALTTVQAAWHQGWLVALLVALDMLLLGVGHVGLAWLKTGHRALYLATATAGVTAAAVAATSHVAWTAVLLAAATAAWGYLRSKQGAAQAVA